MCSTLTHILIVLPYSIIHIIMTYIVTALRKYIIITFSVISTWETHDTDRALQAAHFSPLPFWYYILEDKAHKDTKE